MSFTSGPQTERIRSLDDVGTLRALAHPVRRRILNHLMTFGARTASQCATVVGETPSNCSYHLRELHRFGLVERAPAIGGSGDGGGGDGGDADGGSGDGDGGDGGVADGGGADGGSGQSGSGQSGSGHGGSGQSGPTGSRDRRERLWRSTATGLRTDLAAVAADPALRAAELAVTHGDLAMANELTDAALRRWEHEAPEWQAAATLSSYGLRMTAEELAGLVERLDILIRPFISLTREPVEGTEIVHLRIDAFRHPGAS